MVNFTKLSLWLLLAKYVKLTATWQKLFMIFQIGRIHRPMLLLDPLFPILVPNNHQNLRTYHLLLLTMIMHLFNLMLFLLLVLNLRYLILLLHLMCLIPGHAFLALVV
jgi:hypothetical protein